VIGVKAGLPQRQARIAPVKDQNRQLQVKMNLIAAAQVLVPYRAAAAEFISLVCRGVTQRYHAKTACGLSK